MAISLISSSDELGGKSPMNTDRLLTNSLLAFTELAEAGALFNSSDVTRKNRWSLKA